MYSSLEPPTVGSVIRAVMQERGITSVTELAELIEQTCGYDVSTSTLTYYLNYSYSLIHDGNTKLYYNTRQAQDISQGISEVMNIPLDYLYDIQTTYVRGQVTKAEEECREKSKPIRYSYFGIMFPRRYWCAER